MSFNKSDAVVVKFRPLLIRLSKTPSHKKPHPVYNIIISHGCHSSFLKAFNLVAESEGMVQGW